MFYCNECADKKGLDKTLLQSYGPCEICKKTTRCNDSGKQTSASNNIGLTIEFPSGKKVETDVKSLEALSRALRKRRERQENGS